MTEREPRPLGESVGSIISSSLSPGNPQAAEPKGCCALPRRFRGSTPGHAMQNLRHAFSDNHSQATEVSPRHLVNLPQICADFVWASGFHQESAESSTPTRADSGPAFPALLLYSPPS